MNEDTLVKDVMDDMSTLQKATQTVLKYRGDLIVEYSKVRSNLESYKKQVESSNNEFKNLHLRYAKDLTEY